MLRGVGEVLVHPVGPSATGDRDDSPYSVPMADRELQRHRGAHAVAEDVCTVDPQVIEEPDDVARQRGRGDLAVDVRGAAVTLHLDADHPMPGYQFGDQPREVEVDA